MLIRSTIDLSYLIAACLFIYGLKKMSAVKSARTGNTLAAAGMLLAVVVTLLEREVINYQWIVIGIVLGTLIGAFSARLVQMTAMPQMVGIFNGFGGLASALVACAAWIGAAAALGTLPLSSIVLGTFIGAVTFTGSMIAFGKLQGLVTEQPVTYPLQKTINLIITLLCITLGVIFVLHPTRNQPTAKRIIFTVQRQFFPRTGLTDLLEALA